MKKMTNSDDKLHRLRFGGIVSVVGSVILAVIFMVLISVGESTFSEVWLFILADIFLFLGGIQTLRAVGWRE